MKTLSVKQPWASLICSGIKDIENRSWHTLYRGKLLIHASLAHDVDFQFTAEIVDLLPFGLVKRIVDRELPYGTIIGSVELVDCILDSQSFWAEPDCYHWVLKNAVLFDEPIPAKGKLSLWEYEGDIPA